MSMGKYSNGRTAIFLRDAEGWPLATATVNIPSIPIAEDEVIIKNYSENEGMYKCLRKAGIISEYIRIVRTGYVMCPVCKLLIR